MAPICRAGLSAWWLYSLSFTRVKGPSVFCFSNIRPARSVKKYIFRRKNCKKCTVATTIKREKIPRTDHPAVPPALATPLFRSVNKHRQLAENAMTRTDVLRMIKRRALAAGLPYSTCWHTFRTTGITAYLEARGTIENAQAIAAHESPRTAKLYDRTGMKSRLMRSSGSRFNAPHFVQEPFRRPTDRMGRICYSRNFFRPFS